MESCGKLEVHVPSMSVLILYHCTMWIHKLFWALAALAAMKSFTFRFSPIAKARLLSFSVHVHLSHVGMDGWQHGCVMHACTHVHLAIKFLRIPSGPSGPTIHVRICTSETVVDPIAVLQGAVTTSAHLTRSVELSWPADSAGFGRF